MATRMLCWARALSAETSILQAGMRVVKDKFFYELGQKTLSDSRYLKYAHLDPVARGKQLLADEGMRALLSESNGLVLGIGKTWGTAPTPGAWMLIHLIEACNVFIGSFVPDS